MPEGARLVLAAHKTDAVLISSRMKTETSTVKIGGATITSRQSLKYLGVMIDRRLSFKEYLAYASGKVIRADDICKNDSLCYFGYNNLRGYVLLINWSLQTYNDVIDQDHK